MAFLNPIVPAKIIIIINIIIIIINYCFERRMKLKIARALHKRNLFFIILFLKKEIKFDSFYVHVT